MKSLSEQWVRAHAIRAPHIVVLGLGDGDHLREWLAENESSRITVIETEAVKIAQCENQTWASSVDFLHIVTSDALMEHPVMKLMAEKMPPVLCFQPGYGSSKALYDEYFKILTGRNLRGLNYFLDYLGFNGERSIEVSLGGRLITIKELGLMIDTHHSGHQRATAIRVLRELVI